MNAMASSDALDKIDERALDDGQYQEYGIHIDDLAGVSGVRDGNLLVDEGADIKGIEIVVVNVMSVGIFYPGWFWETLEDVAPSYAEEQDPDAVRVDSPADDVQAFSTAGKRARARGFVKWLARICADLDGHDRDYERYNFGLYNKLIEANSLKMNIDTNPFETKAFLARTVPKRIHADDPDDEGEDHDVQSAAEW